MRRFAFDRALKPLGVTRSQWWVLAHLIRDNGPTQTELANTLEFSRVALGGLLDRLEAAGWIERQPDQEDRRAKRVFLTDKVKNVKRAMAKTAANVNEKSLRGLTEAEVEQLINTLIHVKGNLL
ncbi:MAG: MarR family winged helix-turn-helix transcriptional regulator [Alphaproteobacteria bacterium]